MTDTAYDKGHPGSMKLSVLPDNKITIKANHVTDKETNPIGVYRWVDALHDFESYLKKPLNKLLREQYGIGTTTGKGNDFTKHDFTKHINNEIYASTKTTSSRNTLHEILDHEEIWLQDSAGTTVITYPDTTGTNTTFNYTLPKLLGIYDVNSLPTESILKEYPEGDLLLDITGNKDDFFNNASKIKNFLGINDDTDTYLKDSANIPTTTFQEIFKPTGYTDALFDYSFFSEILDPSSEQSDIITTHDVQLTMLYCMINEIPVYITIQKRKNNKEIWYYAFHYKNDDVLDANKFHQVNFNITSTGAHPAPNIETAVYFIKNEIQDKKISALLHDITTMVARMKNKSKHTLGFSLTKKEAQNVRNSGKFTDFYKGMLLPSFKSDLGIGSTLTPEKMTTIIIAFKTIGDQMYLYDSILLSKIDPAKPTRQPWMVTGDTFLKDYGIYTKSTNIMCPTKYGKEKGSRKLTVYVKPQTSLTDEEKKEREKNKKEKEEKEKKEKQKREETEKQEKLKNEKEYGMLPLKIKSLLKVDSNNMVHILDSFIMGIYNAVPAKNETASRKRDITHFDSAPLTNIHGMTLILLYNAIVHIFLTYQRIEFIQSELGRSVGFKDYTLEQQKKYLQDYKERLRSYNVYVDFINRIPSDGVLSFINYVLINVSEIFNGITDISKPITPLDMSLFYINNTDIVSKLKDLHKHKRASTHLLVPFKDFQRQKIIIDKNLGSIRQILQPIISVVEGGVSIPSNEGEIIQMLKDDINELLSYNTKLGGSTYYDKLNNLLTIINPTEDELSKKEMGSINFNLLYNISASYETAVELAIDIENELGYILLSGPVVNKKRHYVIEDDGPNNKDVNVIEDDGSNKPFKKPEVNVIENDLMMNVENDSTNKTVAPHYNKDVNVIGYDPMDVDVRPVQLLPNVINVGGGKQTKRKRKNQSKTKHNKTKRKKTKRKKTKRKKTKHNKTKRKKTKRNKKN